MRWYKLRSAGFILGCFASANLRAVGRGFARGPIAGARELARAGWLNVLMLWGIVSQHGRYRVARMLHLSIHCGCTREQLGRDPEAAFILAGWLNDGQKFEEAIELVSRFIRPEPRWAKHHGVRGMSYLFLGRYPEALADLTACHELSPRVARDFMYNLHRAYLHGLRGEYDQARAAMDAQVIPPGAPGATADDRLAAFLLERLMPYLTPLGPPPHRAPQPRRGSVGVVIGCFHNAVGHAILDPFHFIQLTRGRFDHLILVHPPYDRYSPATRLAAHILDSYVEQIEIEDLDILNFAWQSLGEIRNANYTFLVYNYWSLNRLAYQARRGGHHPMARGRDYMALPPRMVARAEAICRRNHLLINRPLVILHTREHGYHNLRGQSYRNTDVRNYIPAIRRLIELGYEVVRIGDAKMHSIRAEVPELLELPGTDFYEPILDPYLISRCRFMISCQSGPCSYARVFGKPNLVVNAVYHYTLLPEQSELIAFKQYREAATGRPLGVEEVLRAGGHLFDRTEHFEAAGIAVEDMTPAEILAATEEMVAWLENPATPETPAQRTFRELMERYATRLDPTNPLAHPMTDYIGYALPECRVSDSVSRMRPGYLPDESPAAEPQLRAA